MTEPIPALDPLQQRASDNYALRLYALLDAIRISFEAAGMGPGAVSDVAGHLHYATMTARRLAAMIDLPEEAISLDTKIGAYWAAINNDATVEQITAAVKAGVETVAQMKEYLSIETKERAPKVCPECGAEL